MSAGEIKDQLIKTEINKMTDHRNKFQLMREIDEKEKELKLQLCNNTDLRRENSFLTEQILNLKQQLSLDGISKYADCHDKCQLLQELAQNKEEVKFLKYSNTYLTSENRFLKDEIYNLKQQLLKKYETEMNGSLNKYVLMEELITHKDRNMDLTRENKILREQVFTLKQKMNCLSDGSSVLKIKLDEIKRDMDQFVDSIEAAKCLAGD